MRKLYIVIFCVLGVLVVFYPLSVSGDGRPAGMENGKPPACAKGLCE